MGKRVLVKSGGGVKGAYEAGAIDHIVGTLGVTYDGFTGVSVGAINAGYLAQFAKKDQKASAKGLVDLWHTLDNSSVYKQWWPFKWFHAFWKPSLYDSRPLRAFLRKHFDEDKVRSSGVELRVGAVALKSGEYRAFDQHHPQLLDAILASSAFPAMFLPIEVDGKFYTDGGVRDVTPIQEAIDMGADEIDVLMVSPKKGKSSFPRMPNTLDVAKRAISLMGDEVIEEDVSKALLYNKLIALGGAGEDKRVIKIRILRPSESLTEDSLDFDPDGIKRMIVRGREDASKMDWRD